jgi:hypothetical protein
VLASLFTLIEVGGLVTIIVAGVHAGLPIASTIACVPPLDATVLSGIGFGSLLAFLPSSASRTWPMSWRRRRSRTAIFRAP